MAAALAARTLLTRGKPTWLAAVGIGLLLAGLVTKGSSSLGCLRANEALSSGHGHPGLAVLLAVVAAVIVLVWLRLIRPLDQDEPR
jgi:hypothetical protein